MGLRREGTHLVSVQGVATLPAKTDRVCTLARVQTPALAINNTDCFLDRQRALPATLLSETCWHSTAAHACVASRVSSPHTWGPRTSLTPSLNSSLFGSAGTYTSIRPLPVFHSACQCRYIDFETKLEELRAVRKQQLGIKGGS